MDARQVRESLLVNHQQWRVVVGALTARRCSTLRLGGVRQLLSGWEWRRHRLGYNMLPCKSPGIGSYPDGIYSAQWSEASCTSAGRPGWLTEARGERPNTARQGSANFWALWRRPAGRSGRDRSCGRRRRQYSRRRSCWPESEGRHWTGTRRSMKCMGREGADFAYDNTWSLSALYATLRDGRRAVSGAARLATPVYQGSAAGNVRAGERTFGRSDAADSGYYSQAQDTSSGGWSSSSSPSRTGS